MGVDLCRGEIGMAQHRLDGTQVRTPFEQIGRKGVAQNVRGNPATRDSGLLGEAAEPYEEILARHGGTPVREEDGVPPASPSLPRFARQCGARCRKVRVEGSECRLAQGHQPLALAFAEHAQKAPAPVERSEGQCTEFGHAQPRSVQAFEHRAISERKRGLPSGRGQEGDGFVATKGSRERPRLPRCDDSYERITRQCAEGSQVSEKASYRH